MFVTARLQVRQLLEADIPIMQQVYGDLETMRYVGDGKSTLDLEQCRGWYEITLNNYAKRGYGMSAIAQLSDGAVIGFAGLVHPGGQAQAEIKYALLAAYRGQGYATEMCIGMLAWGKAAFAINSVIATTAPANTASHRVLLKAGMQATEFRANDDGSFTQCFAWQAAAASVN
jgi:[ribosomal protein S5]-alanine N-acetyltransferase